MAAFPAGRPAKPLFQHEYFANGTLWLVTGFASRGPQQFPLAAAAAADDDVSAIANPL
jgi:hypothetical protein